MHLFGGSSLYQEPGRCSWGKRKTQWRSWSPVLCTWSLCTSPSSAMMLTNHISLANGLLRSICCLEFGSLFLTCLSLSLPNMIIALNLSQWKRWCEEIRKLCLLWFSGNNLFIYVCYHLMWVMNTQESINIGNHNSCLMFSNVTCIPILTSVGTGGPHTPCCIQPWEDVS